MSYNDNSVSIPKINNIQKPFKIQPSINNITNKIIKNVNEPLINIRKSENITQTKSSSHVEEIYFESNKKIIFEYRKMFEFSNFCIDKMKEIKKNEINMPSKTIKNSCVDSDYNLYSVRTRSQYKNMKNEKLLYYH